MESGWRARLKKLIDDTPGLTMKGLPLKAGLNASTVQAIISKGASPSIDNFIAICRAAGVRPSSLLDGDDEALSVPVVGHLSAGETWVPLATEESVDFELAGHDTIGVEVRDDAMSPVYRPGDVLICRRQYGPHVDNLIGQDCVVRTAKGEHFIKILKRGTRPGRWTLKSYDPRADDIENVAISWVAPVVWIKRGQG